MHSSKARRGLRNLTSACLQKPSGNMHHAEDAHSLCSPGVTITFVTRRVACWPTLSLAAVTILKTAVSIPFVQMLTGLTISACIAWQETLPSGLHHCTTKALITSN